MNDKFDPYLSTDKIIEIVLKNNFYRLNSFINEEYWKNFNSQQQLQREIKYG